MFLDQEPWAVGDYLGWDIDGCVMQLTREALGLKSSLKLCNALATFGIEFDETRLHGALYDAEKASELMLAIVNEGMI